MSGPAETPGDVRDRAFPVLRPAELGEAAPFGSERDVAAGDTLFVAGATSQDLFIVLAGAVEVVRLEEGADTEVIAS